VDWCKRIKDAGWRVVYLPQAVVVHHEAKSSSQVSVRRMIYFNTSKVRYLAKHHGPTQAAIARLSLLTLLRWEWFIEAGKWLAGHKRPLRAERMRAYSETLRSGFK
jgi:GT2 family glycosyltransferase